MPLKPFFRRSRLVGLALLAAATLALQVGCTTLDERQRGWIFQPGDRTWGGGLAAAEGMEDVWIPFESRLDESRGAAVRLHGLWLPQADPNAPVLLYLHGARYDVRGSAPRMRRMHELGFSVLGVDYRGFGRSTAGLPSEAMAAEDARAAWDWLARQHPDKRRFIFGHSLGGAIAVQLASEVGDENGLIVEGSFTSIPDVVGSFRWGWLPVSPLITQRFDAAARVAEVGSPLLVVHGSRDSLIPYRLGQGLYERARGPKRFVLVEGGSHHNTNAVGQAQYREALTELFGL
ncbi:MULTISPECIES: alpha/beta hydrolase [unclassified Roseateles]|uniref:alpha/beta hydrolase n=1 Tax=unclassified Roseateles TaxID=2626991 RepID=UPI0006FFA676|nr:MULTISPECIES: alpha/beta fold hydrolase [unclassified Roseateles]KQW46265.1 alpha/beta hydrolase [Pelomonas sp. Root405]KRA73314.1 alpha/beta hydrolase [Pelomonas sp. Root662]